MKNKKKTMWFAKHFIFSPNPTQHSDSWFLNPHFHPIDWSCSDNLWRISTHILTNCKILLKIVWHVIQVSRVEVMWVVGNENPNKLNISQKSKIHVIGPQLLGAGADWAVFVDEVEVSKTRTSYWNEKVSLSHLVWEKIRSDWTVQ